MRKSTDTRPSARACGRLGCGRLVRVSAARACSELNVSSLCSSLSLSTGRAACAVECDSSAGVSGAAGRSEPRRHASSSESTVNLGAICGAARRRHERERSRLRQVARRDIGAVVRRDRERRRARARSARRRDARPAEQHARARVVARNVRVVVAARLSDDEPSPPLPCGLGGTAGFP